jgi:competence protein ComEC
MLGTVQETGTGRSTAESRALSAITGLVAALAEAVEQQRDRWFLWVPVCLAAGIAAYFALPVEPHWTVVAVAALVLAGLAAAAIAGRFQPLSLFLALLVAGGLLGKLRTEIVDHPELLATTGVVDLAGWVEGVEALGRDRLRVEMRVDDLAGLRPEFTPPRVRVNIDDGHAA